MKMLILTSALGLALSAQADESKAPAGDDSRLAMEAPALTDFELSELRGTNLTTSLFIDDPNIRIGADVIIDDPNIRNIRVGVNVRFIIAPDNTPAPDR